VKSAVTNTTFLDR
jgi:hypothetical protein